MSDTNRGRIRLVEEADGAASGGKDVSQPKPKTPTKGKIGDFGKGSREQTQGGRERGGRS